MAIRREGTFISAFAFVVRTTTGALRRGNCISHSVVGKLGHISRVATLGGAAFARYSGAFGVRTRGEGKGVVDELTQIAKRERVVRKVRKVRKVEQV